MKNQKNGNNHIKKVDSIRIKNLADNIKTNKKFIFEFLLIELLEELLYKLHKNNNEYSFYLYTIIQLSKVNINKINKYITEIINIIVTLTNQCVRPSEIILNAYKFIELTGCSEEFLVKYLESKFKKGMSWKNHGYRGWHIDHIVPISKFNLLDEAQVLKANNYKNLQPLWAKENMFKSDKYF